MEQFKYYAPTKILFGKNTEAEVGELCKTQGASKVLVHFGGSSAKKSAGGTNEKFALANLPDCTLIVHQQNAEIPGLIAEEKADIMITETMEARRYVRDNAKLAAPLIEEPFTKNNFGILMQQGDQIFLNYVNMWMEEMELNGTFARLDAKYIK